MNLKSINRCLNGIIILLALCFYTINTSGQSKSQEDTTAAKLLQQVRIAFNQNNEQKFYEANAQYRKYLLGEDNINGYYLCWKNEVLYDVNHNHFYRALRKTMKMQAEMERRGDDHELYKVTQLRGIIYSLRGNIPLAHQYFEKALDQVDHSQLNNLASIYMDLSNIEMDTQPDEAMKHLDCAIEIIKGNGSRYDYSDAIGFKVIVAYAMRDWKAVNTAFSEYITLKEELEQDFSTTYYYYALICKAVADKRYDDAIKLTYNLTNTTDIYKFQTEIYELSGDTQRAFDIQKHYMAIKDSVNNVIMSEEIMGTASDLENAEARSLSMEKHNTLLKYAINIVFFGALLIGLLIYRMNKNRYMRKLQRQNHDLLIARDKAQEANRMKISFLQNMSHEIRTPLNIISGYAQIISDPRTLTSDSERADIAKRISHSTNTIVRIVDEILDISSKESIHYIDKSDLVACNDLLRRLAEPYQDYDAPFSLRLELLLKDSCKILVNRKEVQKILNHLMDNAIKFTPQGGTITLRSYQHKLNQNLVCLSVTDTGCGIKDGDEEKIFEHFYKSDIYKEGVGLGLSVARRVARQLGGDVVLDTRYKEGSRFILQLPKE
jgi:signal transduction histidine kinase